MGVETTETVDGSPAINTANDYLLHTGQNLPNHTYSRLGLGKFVSQGVSSVPGFRTREDAYRYAAWLITLAEVLPFGEGISEHSFEQALDAIRNA